MLKKILCLILAAIMSLSVFTAVPIIKTKAQTVSYDSADIYVADCLTYGLINPETGASESSPYVSTAILHDFTYEILAEALIEDEQLIINSLFWNNLRKALSGEFLEIVNWQEAFYTVLLMDYINYSSNTYEYRNYLVENTVKYTNEVYSAIIEYNSDWYEGNVDDLIKNASLTEAVEFSKEYGYLYKLNKFNTLAEDIVKVSKNGLEYFNNLSKALAIQEASENRVDFLVRLKNKATDNPHLISAIDRIVEWYSASYSTLAFDNSVYVMAKYSVSATFDCIVKAFPTLKNLVATLKVSTGGLDLLFNSDDLSENNLKLLLLYIIHSYSMGVLQDVRDAYRNSSTKNNANILNNTFICYVDYQNYASYHTKGFISSLFYDGIYNKIENIFSDSNEISYNEFQGYLESDIKFCEGLKNLVNSWFNLYQGFWGNESEIFDNEQEGTDTPSVEEVRFQYESYTLFFNQTLTNKATVYSADTVVDSTVSYYSGNESIATVDSQGRITPVKPGKVLIYAKTTNGTIGNCYVTVLPFYVLSNSDGYVINKYVGDGSDVKIPSYVNGIPVVEIYDKAFRNCFLVTSVKIPDTVTKIGVEAFSFCSKLVSVNIPDSVKEIGDDAFIGCDSLIEISIPSSVETFGKSIFEGLDSLKKVTLGNGIKSISDHMFSKCPLLETLIIPDSVNSIGNYAFFECKSLSSVTIPQNVSYIGNHAFNNCDGITSIIVPDNVKNLGTGAFSQCSSLKTAYIGKNASNLYWGTFNGCSSLVSITVDNDNANYSSENGVLFNKNKTKLIIFPSKNVNTIYSVPESVTLIGENAFAYCFNLKNVILPDNLKTIGECAFEECRSLVSVNIPESVETIEYCAFWGCSSLAQISISDSVKTIGQKAFCYCTSLEYAKISNSIDFIDHGTFAFCHSLKKVIMPENVTKIGIGAFYECKKLSSIIIPDSVVSTDEFAFELCDNLTVYCKKDIVSEIDSSGAQNIKFFGDMDNNMILDSADIIKMKKSLLGILDSYFDEIVADINRDKSFNIIDLVRLKKILTK